MISGVPTDTCLLVDTFSTLCEYERIGGGIELVGYVHLSTKLLKALVQ